MARRYVILLVDSDGANVVYSEIPEIQPHTAELGLTWGQYQCWLEKQLLKLQKLAEVYDEKEDVGFEIWYEEVEE